MKPYIRGNFKAETASGGGCYHVFAKGMGTGIDGNPWFPIETIIKAGKAKQRVRNLAAASRFHGEAAEFLGMDMKRTPRRRKVVGFEAIGSPFNLPELRKAASFLDLKACKDG
jgi:hypothetical protein